MMSNNLQRQQTFPLLDLNMSFDSKVIVSTESILRSFISNAVKM